MTSGRNMFSFIYSYKLQKIEMRKLVHQFSVQAVPTELIPIIIIHKRHNVADILKKNDIFYPASFCSKYMCKLQSGLNSVDRFARALYKNIIRHPICYIKRVIFFHLCTVFDSVLNQCDIIFPGGKKERDDSAQRDKQLRHNGNKSKNQKIM